MKPESETREMRDRIVSELKNEESGSSRWQKLEAAEVALDWVLEENEILEAVSDGRGLG